jgi:hypothetical protein
MWVSRASIGAVLASMLVAACGDEPGRKPSTVHQRPELGYSLTVPDGWHRAAENLTPHITDPVETLSLATTAFDPDDRICDALKRVVPDGAFLTLQERGAGVNDSPEFPARPAHFRPRPAEEGYSTWPWCGAREGERPIPMDHYWFTFRDAGRAFHVLVAFGEEAPEQVREEAFAALDSLRLDPEVKPDWASTEAYVHRDGELGFAATIPAGWWRADHAVDDLTTNPRELLVLSTFELPEDAKASDRCGPFYDHVLDEMPDDGALLAVRESFGKDLAGPFEPRPKAFELEPVEPEAGGCRSHGRRTFRRWWLQFRAGGRDFYAQVDMGLDAPVSLRRDAEAVLNSFSPRAD